MIDYKTNYWCLFYAVLSVHSVMCILTSPLKAEQLIPLTDNWGTTIYKAIAGEYHEVPILEELNRIDRFARFDYYHHLPYSLSGLNGKIELQKWGRNFSLFLPFSIRNHGFTFRLDSGTDYTEGYIESNRKSSRFGMNVNSSNTRILLAQHWKSLQLRWGISMRWTHQNSKTRLEPSGEIGWGEMSKVRFRIRVYQYNLDNPWNWALGGDELTGHLAVRVEGLRYEMGFGEPFGTQMRIIAKDEHYRSLPNNDTKQYKLTPIGKQKSIGVFLECPSTTGLGWQIGGTHINLPGDIKLCKEEERAAEAPEFDNIRDIWNASLNGHSRIISWNTGINYYRWKGRMNGWLFPAQLPDNFANMFPIYDEGENDDFNYFFSDALLEGYSIHGSGVKHGKHYRIGLEIGYIDLNTRFIIDDFAPETDIQPRLTRLPLNGFSALWSTLHCKITAGKWAIGGSFSQAFIINQNLQDDDSISENASLSGGRLGRIWLKRGF